MSKCLVHKISIIMLCIFTCEVVVWQQNDKKNLVWTKNCLTILVYWISIHVIISYYKRLVVSDTWMYDIYTEGREASPARDRLASGRGRSRTAHRELGRESKKCWRCRSRRSCRPPRDGPWGASKGCVATHLSLAIPGCSPAPLAATSSPLRKRAEGVSGEGIHHRKRTHAVA